MHPDETFLRDVYGALASGATLYPIPPEANLLPHRLVELIRAAGTHIGTGFLAVSKSPSARSDNLIYAYGEVPRALDLALGVRSSEVYVAEPPDLSWLSSGAVSRAG